MTQNKTFILHRLQVLIVVVAVCFAKPATKTPNPTTVKIQNTTISNVTTTVDSLSDYPDHVIVSHYLFYMRFILISCFVIRFVIVNFDNEPFMK